MKVIHKLRMDLARCGCRPILGAVQGEANTRVLEVDLYDNGIAWEIPSTAVVDVAYQKPDGTKGIYSKLPDGTAATTFSGNVLSATIAPQMVTCAGTIRAAFVFSNGGNATLATFPFTITVEANPAAGAERSEDYFNPKDISDLRAEVAAHAGRQDNPHGVTYAQVGAAPAGYCIGDYAKTITGEDLNTFNKGGAFVFDTATNMPGAFNGWCYMSVLPSNGHSAIQTVWGMLEHVGCAMQRVKTDWGTDAWTEWEWVNPPMHDGVEYRTTERYLGKAVYAALLNFGYLPNNSVKNMDTSIVASRVLSCELSLQSEDGGTLTNHLNISHYRAQTFITITLQAATTADLSTTTAYFLVKYTKD